MDYGKINPTKADYIKDIVRTNESLRLYNEQIIQRVHEIKAERDSLERSLLTREATERVYNLTARIIALNSVIRANNRDIQDNLKLLDKLRKGEIYEP